MSDRPASVSRLEGLSYEQTMDLMASCIRPLMHFRVGPLLDAVNRADSVGFLVDPTRYREAQMAGRLDQQRRLLEAVRDLQQVVDEIERDVQEREARKQAPRPQGPPISGWSPEPWEM